MDDFSENVSSGEAFQNKLYEDFEELFETGDGKALDLTVLANNLPVDVILLDCLCYQDDALFAAALGLLVHTYGQRKILLHSLSHVTLLDSEVVPVFGNVAEMSSELGYLLYLVRSSEVWGVSSRVAGIFQPEQYKTVLATCDRISEYLYHAPIESNATSVVKKRLSLAPSLGDESVDNPIAGMHPSSKIEALTDVDHNVSNPTRFHQNVMRSLNLQTTLIAALSMDYNVSFRGSICSPEEKVPWSV